MNPPDRTLIYRVSRGGHVMGEFDIDRIVDLLDSGEFLWTDLCWHQRMSGWTPLANLRSEIAAAKAFPPVAAMPAAVASGRRPRQPAAGAPVAAPMNAAGSGGWWWVVAGVSSGALIGLLTAHFFPTVVQVDKLVEKVIEKPVEVVRVVEKRVDVPAELTDQQKASITFARRLFDPKQRKSGVSLFKISDRVKVIGGLSGSGASLVSEGRVLAKVESAFRNQGFKVLSNESKEYPYTVVRVGGVYLENKSGNDSVLGVSGSYEIELLQPLICFSPDDTSGPDGCVIKIGNVVIYGRSGALNYGVNNIAKIPEVYEGIAEEAANDLRKAQDN